MTYVLIIVSAFGISTMPGLKDEQACTRMQAAVSNAARAHEKVTQQRSGMRDPSVTMSCVKEE